MNSNHFIRMLRKFLCILLCLLLLIGCQKTANIESIENHIAKENDFDCFELHTIEVTVEDSPEHYSHIIVDGVMTIDGIEEEWSNMYSIEYETFLKLYQINNDWYLYDSQNESTDLQPKPLDADMIDLIIGCLSN